MLPICYCYLAKCRFLTKVKYTQMEDTNWSTPPPTQTLGGTPCVLYITTSHTKQVKKVTRLNTYDDSCNFNDEISRQTT